MALTPEKKQKLLKEVQQEVQQEVSKQLAGIITGSQKSKKPADESGSRIVIDPDKKEEHDYKLNLKQIYFYPAPSKGEDAGIYNGLQRLDGKTKAAIAMGYAETPYKYDLETYLAEKIAENKDKPRSGRARP